MALSQLNLGEKSPTPKTLRPYQRDAVDAVLEAHKSVRSTLVVAATGLGKSLILAELAAAYIARGKRVLFVVHTKNLVWQTAQGFADHGLRTGVEQAEHRVRGFPPDVVCCTAQTMGKRSRRAYKPEHFGLIMLDEAHRALGSQHRAIVDYFAGAKVVGCTATPDRTDGVGLANLFETTAFEMDMRAGIEGGWLSPLTLQTVHSDWDPAAVKTVAGECDPASVEAELTRSGLLDEAASALAAMLAEGSRKSCIAFLPTVASARAFAAIMHARGIAAGSVDGTTPDDERTALFASYRRGDVQVLANCAVLTEGADFPDTDCVAILSPTKSRSRLCQAIGRGTRRAPGKEDCLILDFVPGRLTTGRLASPADALAGRMLDDDELAGVRDGDVLESVKAAELEGERLKELRAVAAQEEEARKERLARIRENSRAKAAQFSVERHSFRDVFVGEAAPIQPKSPHAYRDPEQEDRHRKAHGMASVKQAAILRRHGFNPNMSRADAGFVMGVLAKNGWRWPGEKPTRLLRRA